FWLNKTQLNHNLFTMMNIEGLNAFPFFRALGGYSVDSKSYTHTKQSLQYSNDLLNSGYSVAIFPQGDEQHAQIRPLQCSEGIGWISEKNPALQIIPIAFHYTFLHHKKPELYIKIGETIHLDHCSTRKERTIILQQHLTHTVDTLVSHVIQSHSFSEAQL
ncbi:MAG: lysophospholipid acyltransferase family protein, partial [Bacilli bacterium]